MGKLILPELGIEFDAENHFFEDWGAVDDIQDAYRRAYETMMGTPEGYDDLLKATKPDPYGFHMHLQLGNERFSIIACKRTDPLMLRINRGQEETHALHYAGGLHQLAANLTCNGAPLGLRRYRNYENCSEFQREIVGNIGGIFAQDKSSGGMRELFSRIEELPLQDQAFAQALRMYTRAMHWSGRI